MTTTNIIEITGTQPVRQGDLLLIPVETIPAGLSEQEPEDGRLILAHSESGHDHAIEARLGLIAYRTDSPLRGYLDVTGDPVDLVHHRNFDTHATFRIPAGRYEIRRQREHTPEGWRRVQD